MSVSSFASPTIYVARSDFLTHLAPSSYTESFDGLGNGPSGAQTFGTGPFAFTAFAPSDLYLAGGFLGTSQINEALTVTFGAGVKAFGADFFTTDLNDAFQSVLVTLSLSDGSTTSFTPTSLADSFRGFVSTVDISSFTISGPGSSLYASLDNLTVGTAGNTVPEPGSLALVGLAAAGLFATRRRAA
ncbi:PEP-CTERM sorting domain-containing protein [Paucibacter sp. APW11]|uniref:PEP-CTERM sorting domain-containing protein n=1 Tax=Roseateles aquae TaxID=3077235 RepID=A0ABU3PGP0_9BURK|nr:PEP-CTERM sorting domain-containing protein [Paucibacter sp. APW11]MDT9001668.1 PEP-CTERM sorting domain-containing protein [Paucibacter sp. APW11]